MRRPGLALILIVGVLGVLAVLGSAFAVLSRLERKAAAQRVHATRAVLLARSGIEDAQARIASGQDPEADASRYAGENWDASSDGLLSGYEAEQEVYRMSGVGTRADVESCPVEQAMRPSFFTRAGSNPAVERTDGRDRGFTGRLGGGSYALKITTGGFDVNGGDPSSVPTPGDFNENLRRMLGILTEAIDREDGMDDGMPVDAADGLNLIDSRPSAGWGSLDEIRDQALGGSAAKLDALGPYLTLDAWRDLKVIRGNATEALAETGHVLWKNLKLAHETDPSVPGTHAPDFERIPFSPSGRIVGRAPVDLSWARRHRPALLALLVGLDGIYADHGLVETSGWTVYTRRASIPLDWSTPSDDARLIVDQLLTSGSELRTWQEWDAFCDGLTVSDDGLTPLVDFAWESPRHRQAKRDLLKANFNPNSDLNKFNPDRSLARLLDKSDLLQGSTEFNLVPRGGFRVSSVARVLDGSGRVLALRRASAERGGDALERLSTQREFVCGNLGRLDLAGDESAPRAYGSFPYITPSLGAGKSFGFRRFGGQGMSLQTYPEPDAVWTPPATGNPASFDGQVRLATLETQDGQYVETASSMLFLATWDSSYAASFCGAGGDPHTTSTASAPPMSASVWDNAFPGILYPDGFYSEGTALSYRAPGNLLAHRGVLSFWVKPNYDASTYRYDLGIGRGHTFFNNTRSGACFFLLHNLIWDLGYQQCFAMFYESDPFVDTRHEQMRITPNFRSVPFHRWLLLDYFWDMTTADGDLSARIRVNRGDGEKDQNTGETYNQVLDPPNVDFRYQPQGSLTPARFNLGKYGTGPSGRAINNYAPADSTYDEFISLDFSASAAEAIPLFETLAQDRFAQGRYYKESDYFGLGQAGNKAGEWFSAPLDLGGEKRLVRLAWTQIVPPDLRPPASPGGPAEDSDPGDEGRIALEIADAAGTAYKIPGFHTRAEGSEVNRPVSGPFRLHAVFQPRIQDLDNKPILDSLVLDDVSVVYRDPSSPLFRAWSEGR